MSGGINGTTINSASTAASVGVEPEAGERIDSATNNAVPVSKERAEYVAKAGPYDRYQAMQDLRDANQGKWVYRACRRVFDIVFSGAVITVGLIPGAIICAAICLESPGSPIYSQKRICRTHRDRRMHEFTMYKFRSMYNDADERLKELQGCNEVGGAMFKMKDDPRVTRVGRFLRKHSIDEFPQFINVFLGQMTVVGPRPPLPYEVAEYDAWAMQRLAVKPGLTGYWQVGGRSDLGLRRHGGARPEVHPRAQPPGEFQDHPADRQGRLYRRGGVLVGRPLKIAMIGQKHYGSREGGVEVVVTELARRMAALGHEVTCYDRSGSNVMTGGAADACERVVDGVRVVPVRTIDKKGLAALSSSFFATLAAIRQRPDVIHYHAEGPCVPLRLAHLMGIRTVATIHGLDWQRAKWGKLASTYIKMGEKAAAKKADGLIVLSRSAERYFKDVYGRDSIVIPNGMDRKIPRSADFIAFTWGLSEGDYLLFLGRLVPEKRPELLIEAFKGLDTDKKLVIAGGGSDTSDFESHLHELAVDDPRIVFTGFVSGEPLEELYSNCFAYVLPSDVEGMPMSLLEAMAYGRCCVTSGIPECADVLAGNGVTFEKGSAESLRDVLRDLLARGEHVSQLGIAAKAHVEKTYAWDSVVERTLGLYEGVRR